MCLNKVTIQKDLRKCMYSNYHRKILHTNGYFLARGYEWVQKNLFLPVMQLEKSRVLKRDQLLMSNAYYLLGDISFLINGYSTANQWYLKHKDLPFRDKGDEDYIINDIVTTYMLMGKKDEAVELCQKYHIPLPQTLFPSQKESEITIAYDYLASFKPQLVIELFGTLKTKKIYEAVTCAYGAVRDLDTVIHRLKYYCLHWKPTIEDSTWFFLPLEIFDDLNFIDFVLNSKVDVSYLFLLLNFNQMDYIPYHSREEMFELFAAFQYYRTRNDIRNMLRLNNLYSKWQTTEYCVKFYKISNRMPTWKELIEKLVDS